jgi:nucleoid-associated protein YgaU
MHHSPSRSGRGAGPSSADPARFRPSAGRTLALLLLLGATGRAGPSAAQDTALARAQVPVQVPAPPPAAAPPARIGTPALESALAAEPIPESRSTDEGGPWMYGLVLGGVALAVAGAGLVMYLRRDTDPLPEEPFLVFAPPANPPPALPLRAPAPRAAAPSRPLPAAAPVQAPVPAPARAAAPVPTPVQAAPAQAPVRIQAPRFAPAPPAPSAAELEDELTVRLEVPADGRLQFLPGALEVVDGADTQREIRFLRSGGPVTEYTIGRSGGPATSHVQLPVSTVSRLHARMRFAEGAWTISNLSSTNPLRVNGRELALSEESPALADGDHIEVGEVVLRFRGPGR